MPDRPRIPHIPRQAARRRHRGQPRNPRRDSRADARYRNASFTATVRGRAAIALAAAVALGVIVGIALPRLSPAIGRLTGLYTAVGGAADALNALAVVDDPRPGSAYDRDAFGFRQTDDDGDGCDVREAVLARDLTDVTFTKPGGCQVKSGTLHDPYTGATIAFTRGAGTSAAVQIDHVVALENAWKSGASAWNTARRYQFGNDPLNLLAVDGPTNEEKGSASAAYWLPPDKAYRCAYVARQIGVKAKYALSVTGSEKRAMQGVLHACPGQDVPRS
ncbi:deoxyribonuclease [Bifidobacterium sp. DSM 109958]|uniref:Deoxyribonuclease n=1 Tax=Bifidobacterium moraviense TaxID=2675323 RepID=A0A7Y0HZ75_9BIFI|nr:HNH endonuclease family protein [Bifidobacterium sp. DSM 109958]NMN00474.1 deoxyribonuclease [Bifidobacterium sp. DSM 109958]